MAKRLIEHDNWDKNKIKMVVALCYALFLAKVTLFKMPIWRLREALSENSLDAIRTRMILSNFEPFDTIDNYLSRIHTGVAQANLFGNILIFIPFGMLLALAQRKVTWFGMILYGFFLSLFIEVVQLLTGFGSFDVDDLILNVLGTVIGFGVSKVMIKYRTKG